jgi:hypothetical protein
MIMVSSAARLAEDKPVAVVAALFGERKAPDGTPLGH